MDDSSGSSLSAAADAASINSIAGQVVGEEEQGWGNQWRRRSNKEGVQRWYGWFWGDKPRKKWGAVAAVAHSVPEICRDAEMEKQIVQRWRD